MRAAEAREQSRVNKAKLEQKRFDDLWGQLSARLDEAIERGHFQTELETNATGDVLNQIVAKLRAGKFDVDAVPVGWPTYRLWIGWADDECDANKAKRLPPKPKKRKPKRTASQSVKSAPTA